jgi:uncharacterized membrane protein YhaH (DUF805 family)
MKLKLKQLFLADGKINRKEFALINLSYIILELINLFLVNKGYNTNIYNTITYPVFFLMYFIIACAIIKRFHSINKSGWYLLGLLIPIYNVYLAILLFFKKEVYEDSLTKSTRKPRILKLTLGTVTFIVIGVMGMVGYESYKENKAVEIVKNSNIEDKAKTTDDVVESWMEEEKPNKIYGWNGKRVDKNTYFVTYEFDDDDNVKNGTIIVGGYEVNIEAKTVKSIMNDKNLESKYIELGFIN